ncbi:MAG: hypothetical protein ACRYFX_18540 [Janthinobacterium lividum]
MNDAAAPKLISWRTFSKGAGKNLPRYTRGDCGGQGGVSIVNPTMRQAGYWERSNDEGWGEPPFPIAKALFEEHKGQIVGDAVWHVEWHHADMGSFSVMLYFKPKTTC